MRKQVLLVLILAVVAAGHECSGELVGFEFTGEVNQSGSPYGIAIESGASVSGHFVYDTESPATHPSLACGDDGSNCLGYQQNFPQGFSVTFEDDVNVSVSADEYLVIVDDDPFSGDTFAVTYNSDLLSAPLTVNGLGRPTGRLGINLLLGFTSPFSSADVPANLSLDDFFLQFNLLSDQPTGSGVDFVLDSLTPFSPSFGMERGAVPEPSSGLLVFWAILLFRASSGGRGRRRQRLTPPPSSRGM